MKHLLSMASAIAVICLSTMSLAQAQPNIDPNDTLTGLKYDQGIYVAVGYSSSGQYASNAGIAYLSTDGTTWSRQTNNLNPFGGLAHGNGQYVGFGAHVRFDANTFEYLGFEHYFLVSSNGTDWTQQNTGLPWELNRIIFAADRFVAVGENGTILTSTNGLEWEYPQTATEYNLRDVVYGNGRFVAVGENGAVLTSTDGQQWTNQNSGTVNHLFGVAFNQGRFIAISLVWNYGYSEGVQASYLVSQDGETWTHTVQRLSTYLYYYADRLFAANGLIIIPAMSQSVLLNSNDVHFTTINLGTMLINDLEHINDRYLALTKGAVLTSPDGYVWHNPSQSNAPPEFIVEAPTTTNTAFIGQTIVLTDYSYKEGNPSAQFQWLLNGTNLTGANSKHLFLWNLSDQQAGEYQLMVSNIWGVATSQVFFLTVQAMAPDIQVGSTNRTVLADQELQISGTVKAGPPAMMQWFYADQAIPGATNATLRLPAVATTQAGVYYLVASNALGVSTSSPIVLTVETRAPIITSQPTNLVVAEGSKASFYVQVTGAPIPELYLLFNGAHHLLPGRFGNNPFGVLGAKNFTILQTTTNDVGNYAIMASNQVGMVTSRVATLTLQPAEALDLWRLRNPVPQGNNLLSVTYGNGQFVAVGEMGKILTSTHGTNWSVQALRTDVTLSKVVYEGGQFIAVGESGNILGSSDGANWSLRRAEQSDLMFQSVAYGNGVFVAVGFHVAFAYTFNGATYYSPGRVAIWISTNGWHWTPCNLPVSVLQFTDVAWGNDRFVAVGETGLVGISFNGVDWDVQNLGDFGQTSRITYGKGRFVTVGNNGLSAVSGDGYSWTLRAFGSERRFLGVTYGADLFVTVGTRGTIYTSPDGRNWTQCASPTPDRLESVIYANQIYVALGENGTTLTSPDGLTWTSQNRGSVRDLDGLALGEGMVVVAGKYGTILTTSDGWNYNQQFTGTTNDIHGIAFAHGQYMAVGEQGCILSSSNAVEWTVLAAPDTNTALKRVTWGDGVWMAVGTEGVILMSPDGMNWTKSHYFGRNDLNDVAYGQGRYVIVGDQNPTILYSTNAVDWTSAWNYPGRNMRAVTYANNQFMAVGNDGYIYVSSDGRQWSPRNSGVNYDGANLRSVCHTNGTWIIVGNDGLVLTSTNTFQWQMRPASTIENLHGVIAFQNAFLTIGNRGSIFQSARVQGPRLTSLALQPLVGFGFNIQSQPGYRQRLQSSINLRDWQDILTLDETSSGTNFVDQEFRFNSQRFYRVVSP